MDDDQRRYFDQVRAAEDRRDVEIEIENIAERIKKAKKGEITLTKKQYAEELLLLKAGKDKLKLLEKVREVHDENLSLQDKEAALSYDIAGADKKLLLLKKERNKLVNGSVKLNEKDKQILDDKIKAAASVLSQNKKLARQVQGVEAVQNKILGAIGLSKMGMQGMVSAAKAMTAALLLNPLLLIAAAITAAISLMMKFIGYAQRLSSDLGITASQAEGMAAAMKVAEIEGKIIGYDAVQTGKALAEQFGTMKAVSVDNIRTLGKMQASLGISTSTSATLAKNMMALGSVDGIGGAVVQMQQFAAIAVQNGVVVGEVMNDIANNTEVFADFARDGGDNVARAAVQAKKLGMSIATTAKMASSLLDFESSIEREMEASLMIGKQLNFNKARQLALEGDLAGAAKSVVDQVGGKEAFNKMNVLQRRSVASAAGLDTSELMKFMSGKGNMEVEDPTAKAMNEVNGSVGMTNQLLSLITPILDRILAAVERGMKWLYDNLPAGWDWLKNNWPFLLKAITTAQIASMGLRGKLPGQGGRGIFSNMFGNKAKAVTGPLTKSGRPDMRYAVNRGTNLASTAAKAGGKSLLKTGGKLIGGGAVGALTGGFDIYQGLKSGDTKQTGSGIGSIVGGAIGALGGPVGIAVGTVAGDLIGGYLGGLFDKSDKKKDDAVKVEKAVSEAEMQQNEEFQKNQSAKVEESNAILKQSAINEVTQLELLGDINRNIKTVAMNVNNQRDD